MARTFFSPSLQRGRARRYLGYGYATRIVQRVAKRIKTYTTLNGRFSCALPPLRAQTPGNALAPGPSEGYCGRVLYPSEKGCISESSRELGPSEGEQRFGTARDPLCHSQRLPGPALSLGASERRVLASHGGALGVVWCHGKQGFFAGIGARVLPGRHCRCSWTWAATGPGTGPGARPAQHPAATPGRSKFLQLAQGCANPGIL